MNNWDKKMFDMVNFNHYIKSLEARLNAISARRHRKKRGVLLWPKC